MRMRMLLSMVVAIIWLSIISTSVSGAEFFQDIAKLSDYLIDGTPVTIEMRTTKLTPQYPYKDPFMWGGDEVLRPKTVIINLDVRVGKEKKVIPLSAYRDLGDPYKILLEITQKGFHIIIRGGDAATSYKAVLDFEGEHIKRRKVSHGEFPDEVWEETEYSFIADTGQ